MSHYRQARSRACSPSVRHHPHPGHRDAGEVYGKFTYIEYARFDDDLVILIDAHPRHDWLMGAVEKRLREELAKLRVEINEEKSRTVDLSRGESFGFLGLD
jgi:RNA-directed DNA polymerase